MKEINATKKGIILAVLLIVLSLLLFYVFKYPENGKSQYAVLGLYIAGILWSLISYKKIAPTDASFKDFFSTGFKTFIVVTFFMVIYTFIFYKFNPQILENAIIENNSLVKKEGNRTTAEIEEIANKLRNIFMPMMLAVTTIKFLILGSLISVIGAGFLSQKKH